MNDAMIMPCPVCSNDYPDLMHWHGMDYVKCQVCGRTGHKTHGKTTAIVFWNMEARQEEAKKLTNHTTMRCIDTRPCYHRFKGLNGEPFCNALVGVPYKYDGAEYGEDKIGVCPFCKKEEDKR